MEETGTKSLGVYCHKADKRFIEKMGKRFILSAKGKVLFTMFTVVHGKSKILQNNGNSARINLTCHRFKLNGYLNDNSSGSYTPFNGNQEKKENGPGRCLETV